jgi:F-type H+-transporting ATPase subunit delta
MAEISTLARPYAKAAFEVALVANKVSEWSSMLHAAALIAADASVVKLINDPSLTLEKQTELMLKLCEGYLDDQGQNLIKVLAQNGRLAMIAEIAVQFEELKKEHERLADVNVETAVALSDNQQSQLAEKLKEKLGRDVRINNVINTELLGGMVIRAGDLVIDNTVRGKLNRLTDTLNV